MADARMVHRGIATNEQLEAVSFEADYLFARCIPFLDVEGRMQGQPGRVRALVCPLRAEMTTAIVARCLQELHDAGLAVWYDTPDGRALYFPGFHKHNKVRRDRESASKVAPPPGYVPVDSGSTPGVVREDAGSTPGNLPLEVEVEVEGESKNCTTTTSVRVVASETDRAARVARLVGAFDGPEALGDAFEAVAEALPAVNGRDLVIEVLARAASGPDNPAKFLRSMHNALVPLGGKAATPAQLGLTLLDWLEKADEPTFRLFSGYVRRAHLAEAPQPRAPAVLRPGRPAFPNRETAGADVRSAATAAARRIAEQFDAAQGITRPAVALPLLPLERAS